MATTMILLYSRMLEINRIDIIRCDAAVSEAARGLTAATHARDIADSELFAHLDDDGADGMIFDRQRDVARNARLAAARTYDDAVYAACQMRKARAGWVAILSALE